MAEYIEQVMIEERNRLKEEILSIETVDDVRTKFQSSELLGVDQSNQRRRLRKEPEVFTWQPLLHILVHKNVVSSVQVALQHGTDPNVRSWDDMTPLHIACLRNNLDMIKLLISAKADPSLQNDDDETVLDVARRKEFTDIVGYLEAL